VYKGKKRRIERAVADFFKLWKYKPQAQEWKNKATTRGVILFAHI
jgi:hypothetical protein